VREAMIVTYVTLDVPVTAHPSWALFACVFLSVQKWNTIPATAWKLFCVWLK
jgi:hypothetical protein